MSAVLEAWGFTLLDPWLLLFLPAFVAVAVWRCLRPAAAMPAADIRPFQGLPRTLRIRMANAPLWLTMLAGATLSLALARPVRREVIPQRQEGIEIALVVDVSSSMNIEDTKDAQRPRRIDAARERAMEFARARKDDRVSFVAFSRYAELRCPPTLDEVALAAFLLATDTVPENSELDGTAIGVAIAKAAQLFESSDAKSKVMVLLSDGETTVQTIEVADAIKLAKDGKIRVHTIGLGQGAPTLFGFQPLEFSDLKKAAAETGGKFFQPKTDKDLADVYAQIDELEKTELEDPRHRFVDAFGWPLCIGLSCALLALLLEVFWLRGAP